MFIIDILNKSWLLYPFDEPVIMDEKNMTYLDANMFYL
jgi:hypothetical protein